ncbi:hypothetical protein [Rhodopseudomonas sp. RCAM05734]|uniref:hypothetical protein n=1 Tax=Rhodopseudomonas sp. RCAM05734 TaxID=3457549 RepID=UPI0040449DF2
MDSEESAVARQVQVATELREVEYEINEAKRRKNDYLDSIGRNQRTGGPAHELERLRELVGQCDVRLLTNDARKRYLERALEDATLNLNTEHKYKLALKPKKPKPKM